MGNNNLNSVDNANIYIYIYGVDMNGKAAYDYLSAQKRFKIAGAITWDGSRIGDEAFSDENANEKVYIKDIREIDRDARIILAVGKEYRAVNAERLRGMGFQVTNVDQFVFERERSRLEKVRSWLADEESKLLFDELIRFRCGDETEIDSRFVSENQYYAVPAFRVFSGDDGYIDAGAYVGDTVERYIQRCVTAGGKMYAFEPGEKQFEALTTRAERLRKEWALEPDAIRCIHAALADKEGECSLSNQSSGGCIGAVKSGEAVIKVHAVDQVVGTDRIGFIKADIEGSELKMLCGARETIQRCRPKMAISIYHRSLDFFEIPEFIKELVPEYHFSIRHHSFKTNETVLYCWV